VNPASELLAAEKYRYTIGPTMRVFCVSNVGNGNGGDGGRKGTDAELCPEVDWEKMLDAVPNIAMASSVDVTRSSVVADLSVLSLPFGGLVGGAGGGGGSGNSSTGINSAPPM